VIYDYIQYQTKHTIQDIGNRRVVDNSLYLVDDAGEWRSQNGTKSLIVVSRSQFSIGY